MIYLASPYSHVGHGTDEQKKQTRERNYRYALFAQHQLLTFGYPVFSTIVHNHILAKRYELPSDAGYWTRYNHHMIDLSRAVFVLQTPGYEESIGVNEEIDYANSRAIPVYRMQATVDTILLTLDVPIIPEFQTLLRYRNPPNYLPVGPVTISE